MPAARALLIGEMNAVASTTVVAIPGEFAATAEFSAVSMVGTVGCVEVAPVQAGVGMPSKAAASANPYWVGVKKELSVTWLTKVNFHPGVFANSPAPSFVLLALLGDELHAASSADAAAVALTMPAPDSRRRRDGPSFMFSVWIASSTFGSIFLIADLQLLIPEAGRSQWRTWT